MRHSKLFSTLLALSAKELKQLEASLHTLKSSTGQELLSFFQLLKKRLGDPDYKLDKAQLFRSIYGDSVPYQEKRIRVLISQLFQHIHTYLAQVELAKYPVREDLLALAQFRKRRIEDVFGKQYKKIKRLMQESPQRDSDHYFATYELAKEANGFYGQQHLRKLDDSLQVKMDSLDAWYLGQKLKESCEMLNRQNVFSVDFQNPMIKEILTFLQEGDHEFWQIPSIQVYYQIYLCLADGRDEQYQSLVDLLDRLFSFFQPEEARGLYKHAQNFCIRRINQGESEYLFEIFKLYRQQLANEIIFDRGELAHTDYKNIVTVALRLKEYDWVEDFIHQYKERVQASFRENVFNFSLASYFFETDQSKQAIRLLQGVEFTDVYYQISARQLLLRIYYESNELESALYQIDSFGGFLRRNKEISAKNRTQQTNFLRWLKHLIRLKDRKYVLSEKDFSMRWHKLKDNIYSSKQTSNLEWLKLKVSELGNKEYGI
ncbi:MAG: hypothetical protein AAF587_16470 [Bacteroidota bacterium]